MYFLETLHVFFFSIFQVFFAFHAISNIKKKYWKVPLHLLVKWEVVSPNSREGQLESISIVSSIPLFWFCISKWGGGVGVLFFSHFMLYPTFLEKNIWEYKPIIYSISNRYITKMVVLVSEPVRGRSRATELPCCLLLRCEFLVRKVTKCVNVLLCCVFWI